MNKKLNPNLEVLFYEHIDELIKGLTLKSKTEKYWHPHKREDVEITSYWNETKGEWGTKKQAIVSEIVKSLRPTIDKSLEKNKNFIEFFL